MHTNALRTLRDRPCRVLALCIASPSTLTPARALLLAPPLSRASSVGFLEPPTRPDTLWITNRVVDGIFVLDVLFQFFIMVPKSSAMSSAFGQGDDGITRWETDVRVIGRLYLRGWFFIDVVSIAPFIFDILPLLRCACVCVHAFSLPFNNLLSPPLAFPLASFPLASFPLASRLRASPSTSHPSRAPPLRTAPMATRRGLEKR